jgi:hypothetical protein
MGRWSHWAAAASKCDSGVAEEDEGVVVEDISKKSKVLKKTVRLWRAYGL